MNYNYNAYFCTNFAIAVIKAFCVMRKLRVDVFNKDVVVSV